MLQGSTGVKFGDVAGIDEAVDELQEVSFDQISGKITTFKFKAVSLFAIIICTCIISFQVHEHSSKKLEFLYARSLFMIYKCYMHLLIVFGFHSFVILASVLA